MEIRSKESFIELFLAVMVKCGYKVGTYNFEDELLKMMYDRKYEKLFYFFNDLSDLNFDSELSFFKEQGLIITYEHNDNTTIKFLNHFLFPVSGEILKKYNLILINLMEQLITELNLSKSLLHGLSQNIKGIYKLSNPNKCYVIGESMSIVTNGCVKKLEGNTTGACLVEHATFVVLQRYIEDQLKEIEVIYRFEDRRYLHDIIRKIINLSRTITSYDKMFNPELLEERNEFEELTEVRGYRYKKI